MRKANLQVLAVREVKDKPGYWEIGAELSSSSLNSANYSSKDAIVLRLDCVPKAIHRLPRAGSARSRRRTRTSIG